MLGYTRPIGTLMTTNKRSKDRKSAIPERKRKKHKTYTFHSKGERDTHCKQKAVKWLGQTAAAFGVPYAELIASHAKQYV